MRKRYRLFFLLGGFLTLTSLFSCGVDRWPEYYDAMHRFQKEGHNLHDDAPDATTGIAETIGGGPVYSFD